MTAPTTLTDDDYRAIARAARRYTVTYCVGWCIEDRDGTDGRFIDVFGGRGAAFDQADDLNGRAAVAEYERRKR